MEFRIPANGRSAKDRSQVIRTCPRVWLRNTTHTQSSFSRSSRVQISDIIKLSTILTGTFWRPNLIRVLFRLNFQWKGEENLFFPFLCAFLPSFLNELLGKFSTHIKNAICFLSPPFLNKGSWSRETSFHKDHPTGFHISKSVW